LSSLEPKQPDRASAEAKIKAAGRGRIVMGRDSGAGVAPRGVPRLYSSMLQIQSRP
jgi:hypothetical protein